MMRYHSITLCLTIYIFVLFVLPFSAYAVTVEITATVPGCGDNIIGVGEQCDGSSLGGASCSSRGFSGGTLSCASSCVFNTSQCTSGGGGGGGGGGGFVPSIPLTNVVFVGKAYPQSVVTLLKDAQIVATTIAGSDANFQMTISNVSGGNYIFGIYSEDTKGVRSSLLNFPVSVTSGVTTKVSGIFIAPTIATDKSEVKRGDTIKFFGQSLPQADISIVISSEEEFFGKTVTGKDGAYLYYFDTSFLSMGNHSAKSKASIGNLEISGFSGSASFVVGKKNVTAEPVKRTEKVDINNDKRVNIIDFSIAAYWYKRSNPPASVDLNNDGKINLVDFSIMAFNWTG